MLFFYYCFCESYNLLESAKSIKLEEEKFSELTKEDKEYIDIINIYIDRYPFELIVSNLDFFLALKKYEEFEVDNLNFKPLYDGLDIFIKYLENFNFINSDILYYETQYFLGKIYYILNEYKLSVLYFNNYVNKQKLSVNYVFYAYFYLAYSYYFIGNYKKSFKFFDLLDKSANGTNNKFIIEYIEAGFLLSLSKINIYKDNNTLLLNKLKKFEEHEELFEFLEIKKEIKRIILIKKKNFINNCIFILFKKNINAFLQYVLSFKEDKDLYEITRYYLFIFFYNINKDYFFNYLENIYFELNNKKIIKFVNVFLEKEKNENFFN